MLTDWLELKGVIVFEEALFGDVRFLFSLGRVRFRDRAVVPHGISLSMLQVRKLPYFVALGVNDPFHDSSIGWARLMVLVGCTTCGS